MTRETAVKLAKIFGVVGYALVLGVLLEIIYTTFRGVAAGASFGQAFKVTMLSLVGVGDAVPMGFFQAGVVGVGMIWSGRVLKNAMVSRGDKK